MAQQTAPKPAEQSAITKRLVIVGGGKGGVGKSTFARALTDYYELRGAKVLPVDGDVENPTLSRFHENAAPLVAQTAKGFESLIASMEQGEAPLIVADLGAGTGQHMAAFEKALGLASAAREFGYEPTLVFMLAPSKDSVGLLGEAVKDHGKEWNYVIVRALHKTGSWEIWQTSNAKQAVDKLDPEVIDLPILDGDAFSAVDKADLRFKDAKRPELSYTSAAYTARWFDAFCKLIDQSDALRVGKNGKA